MPMMTDADASQTYPHDHDADWAEMVAITATAVARFDPADPLFRTSAADLWETYLDALPAERQVHNCTACRRFIREFGGLATIDPKTGGLHPAIWTTLEVPEFYRPALRALRDKVKGARIEGVFLTSDTVLGTPRTGSWSHLAVALPDARRFRHLTLKPHEAEAAKLQDYNTVRRALGEFPIQLLNQAYQLLKSERLHRAERFLDPIAWMTARHTERTHASSRAQNALLWRAVATAPDGFCHLRASVLGSLLEDLAANVRAEDAIRRFNVKVNGVNYQRPKAAPAAGNIAVAEKLVEKMGIKDALDRRFARLEEIETFWRPHAPEAPANSGGVFGHVRSRQAPPAVQPLRELAPVTLTWAKFRRTVLPDALAIDVMVPYSSLGFAAMVTAAHADAPPILKWDREDRRNPVSLYVYTRPSRALLWNLTAGTWCAVTGIADRPNLWGDQPLPHLGLAAFFILQGARDTLTGQGNALFPATLRGELHAVRATIEAYSKTAELTGREEASACGIVINPTRTDDLHLRVRTAIGSGEYRIDRWD